MSELTDLLEVIPVVPPHVRPKPTAKIQVAACVEPYVAPTYHIKDDDNSIEVELLFVSAPAAVGKSSTATYISSERNIPVLDLARVMVASGSLSGILGSSFPSEIAALDMFNKGSLPIIIDALDEGRILSVKHFDSFLESAVEYVADGIETQHPKIILFGRTDAIELSRYIVESANSRLSTSVVELEYFDQTSGAKLISLSAAEEIRYQGKNDQLIDRRIRNLSLQPCKDLIDAYFDAIESALTINRGDLWKTSTGRAFAGYAPVLVAIGIAIGETTNFENVRNKIQEQSSRYAWDIINKVLSSILEREKDDKLKKALKERGITSIPDNAYDRDEQLTYLTQRISGREIKMTDRVQFSDPKGQTTYSEQVRVIVDDHPFIRGGKMANDVLGSAILSYALSTGQKIENREIFKRLYRQPFLWRHIQRDIGEETLLDGDQLGALLSSYWTDPLVTEDPRNVRIEDGEEGTLRVIIEGERGSRVGEHSFAVTAPAVMYTEMSNCIVRTKEELILEGVGSSSRFLFSGTNDVCCDKMTFRCSLVHLTGKTDLRTNEVELAYSNLECSSSTDADIGLNSLLKDHFAWRGLGAKLIFPIDTGKFKVVKMVEDFANRVGNRVAVVLQDDYSPPDGWAPDSMSWGNRYGDDFKNFVRLLVNKGLVTRGNRPSQGKYNFNFSDVNWSLMERQCSHPDTPCDDRRVADFVKEAKWPAYQTFWDEAE